jgi:AraC family transcriptional regulator of adaptative response/methylated-DNA-[protein]-cysteine methyltransferase
MVCAFAEASSEAIVVRDEVVTVPELTDEVAWSAVMARDRAFDGRFVTGVLSTGIYCRPSCAAKHPRRENVRFYADAAAAREAGLRACLRCLPDDVSRDGQAVLTAIAMIKAGESGLANLAARCGYSPTHFQRVFVKHAGLSPAVYARALRQERLVDTLTGAERVTDAIYDSGFSGPSRFYSSTHERLGMTPSAWRDGARGVTIHWAVVPTSLGPMLVAATERGVCRLSFNEDETALQSRFPHAQLHQGGAEFQTLLAEVVAAVETPGDYSHIPIDVQGTAFQEAVWQALRCIPTGETRSYSQIAAEVGKPGAVRAAGSANGANNVAVLIPCHRVIRSDGSLGGYAYGLEIKQRLLDKEREQHRG